MKQNLNDTKFTLLDIFKHNTIIKQVKLSLMAGSSLTILDQNSPLVDRITSLELCDSEGQEVEEAQVDQFGPQSHLKKLTLTDRLELSVEICALLLNSAHVRCLCMSKNYRAVGIDFAPLVKRFFRQLEKISMAGFKKLKGSIDGFVSVMKEGENLLELDLSDCGFRNGHARKLAEGLINSKKLRNLNLSSNNIGKGIEPIAKALMLDCPLRRINLAHCQIDDIRANLLFEGLGWNSNLETLDLSGNSLSRDSMEECAKMINQNKGMTHLNLSENSIDDDGIRILLPQIRKASALRYLNLRGNDYEVTAEDLKAVEVKNLKLDVLKY